MSGPGVADRVAAAMARCDRTFFLPAGQQRYAGTDQPLPIGHGQTNSQPTTVRNMLTLLDPQPGDRVLDVGCGSAWTTALLATLVGAEGSVLGVEIVPDLVGWGAANLAAGLPAEAAPARVVLARPDELGRPDEAPYDRILVSAEARGLPSTLVDQLADGGVMVVPVRGRMLRVTRTAGSAEPEVERHGYYRFVPLVTPPSR